MLSQVQLTFKWWVGERRASGRSMGGLEVMKSLEGLLESHCTLQDEAMVISVDANDLIAQ